MCLCGVRQCYKLEKNGDAHRQRYSALNECVDDCSKQLCESVKRLTCDVDISNHPLHSLLQMSSDECRMVSSVTSSEPFIAYEELENGDSVIAVCTPLMKRVHRLVPQSADVVVVDMGQPVDKRRRCRIVVLTTSSSAGGLPLGVLAATSDTSLRRAVELYASLLDTRCFYGHGLQGPALFLVDDFPALRSALSGVFTASTCLLCTYRLLVAFWRELWDRRSTVSTDRRPHCFALFRAAVFVDTVDQLHARFADVQCDCAVVGSTSTHSHVRTVYDRRAEWSVCCQTFNWSARSCVQTIGANRGLCGYASHALKDSVVDNIKSMKTLQTLLTFVSERCDQYYERRLTDSLSGHVDDASALRFMQECEVNADVIGSVPPSHFSVTLRPSTGLSNVGVGGEDPSTACHVELSIGLCSCLAGAGGAPCVHQWAAIVNTHARSWFIRPVSSPAAQRVLAHIATGLGYAEASWFASLHPLQTCCDDVLMSDDGELGDIITSVWQTAGEQTVEALVTQADEHVTSDVVVNSLPTPVTAADVTGNKQIIINWNGMAYEVSLQEQDTMIVESNDVLAAQSAALSRERLRQSFTKIENTYVNHPDVMETAVNAFCQTVESMELLEHLNSALLCFGNSFLTSGSAALSWS